MFNRKQNSDIWYKELIGQIPDVVYELDSSGKFAFLNKAITQFGYQPEDLLGKHFKVLVHPDDFVAVSQTLTLPQRKGKKMGTDDAVKLFDERRTGMRMTKNLQVRILLKNSNTSDAQYVYVQIHSFGRWSDDIKSKDKVLLGASGIIRDITELKNAEIELRRQREELQKYFDVTDVVSLSLSVEGNVEFINKRGEEIIGRKAKDIINEDWFKIAFPEPDRYELKYQFDEVMLGQRECLEHAELSITTAAGEVRIISWHSILLKNDLGKITGMFSSGKDITQYKQAQDNLQKAYRTTQNILKKSPFGIYIVNEVGGVDYINPAMVDISGNTYEQISELNLFESAIYKELGLAEEVKRVLEKGDSFFFSNVRFPSAQSQKVVLGNLYGMPVEEEGKRKVLIFVEDITGLKRVEEELQIKESAIASSINAITILNLDGVIEYVNQAFTSLWQYDSDEEILGISIANFFSKEEEASEIIKTVSLSGDFLGETVAKKKDNTLFDVQVSASIVADSTKKPIKIMVSFVDITQRKSVEAQLLQSQKMETIGRLAGGVAHDFNNLLTAITNYATLAKGNASLDESGKEDITQIIKVAKRATNLTRQLLSFSRRQFISPQAINLNEFILNVEKMLRRLIREDIEFVAIFDSNIGVVKADIGQLEQALVNLVVNAKDAMPTGGKLIIETANVTFDNQQILPHSSMNAGDFVMLSVKDTGFGMNEEVKQHLFEPFFTTKEFGKGTGLGLSTVYGIIKQHQGAVEIISEENKGTTVKVFLPRTSERELEVAYREDAINLPRGNELIFVVEDEPLVRKVIVRILNRLGYSVMEASEGKEALLVAQEANKKIDLLLTDVVMPQMSGKILADEFANLYPETKILFVSGYTDDIALSPDILKGGKAFLQKPFTEETLAHKLRDMLD
ncbi:MAG: PAS domain S-box protein [Candidatus Omnitrophica bacterium]|nr:PAS domain S-box protein [Candidatus Omnitrophota bacterium]